MEPEIIIKEEKHILCKVTPVSKYLAMILFIILPFIGGYIGYTAGKDNSVTTLSADVSTTSENDTKEARIHDHVLLSEETTIDENIDIQRESRIDITHTETLVLEALPNSGEYIKFDISSTQSLYPGNIPWEESNVLASRLDYNQHLKFNGVTKEWYLEGVDEFASTTLFKVHEINQGEDIIKKLSDLYKTTSLDEYERSALLKLAKNFPQTKEEFFLNREFCEITKKQQDGNISYFKAVKSEFKQAVDDSGEHWAVFCYSPTVYQMGTILVEDYVLPMDATEPKAFNFELIKKEEVSTI